MLFCFACVALVGGVMIEYAPDIDEEVCVECRVGR